MARRLDVRRWLTATLLSLGLAAGTLGAQPASADAATDAPVTAPDKATVWSGSAALVDAVANDSDPQGDPLAVCRVAQSPYRNVELAVEGGQLIAFASSRAKAGTYELTYYACDFEYLTPGTVTVTVKKAKRVRVTRIDGRPGKLKVANPNSRNVVVMWGSIEEDEPDGTLRLGAHKAQVITVTRTRIFWIAFFPKEMVFVGAGFVRGIELPERVVPQRTVDVSPRLDRLWDAHR